MAFTKRHSSKIDQPYLPQHRIKLLLRNLLIIAALSPLHATASYADEALSPVMVDAGGEVLVGIAAPVADDRTAGQTAYSEKAIQAQQDLLVHGSVDAALGSALTFGGYVNMRVDELRRSTFPDEPDAADFLKSAYIHLKHDSYGDLQIGHEADVRVQQGYWAPQLCDCLDGFLGTNSPQLTFNGGPAGNNSTTVNLDGRSVKAAWYSPEISGFTAAISYAPETPRPYRLNPRTAALGPRYDAPLDQFVSGALDWQGVVGETSVGMGGGITTAHRKQNGAVVTGRNDADPMIWDAGFQASYAAWKFGMAYEQQNGVNVSGIYGAAAYLPAPGATGKFLPPETNAVIMRTFDIGFTYFIGPVTAGLAWSRGFYEGLADLTNTKHVSTADTVFAGASYQWRNGVSLLVGLQENYYDPRGAYRALPAAAGLNRVFGGVDSTVNIWGKSAQEFLPVIAASWRF